MCGTTSMSRMHVPVRNRCVLTHRPWLGGVGARKFAMMPRRTHPHNQTHKHAAIPHRGQLQVPRSIARNPTGRAVGVILRVPLTHVGYAAAQGIDDLGLLPRRNGVVAPVGVDRDGNLARRAEPLAQLVPVDRLVEDARQLPAFFVQALDASGLMQSEDIFTGENIDMLPFMFNL